MIALIDGSFAANIDKADDLRHVEMRLIGGLSRHAARDRTRIASFAWRLKGEGV
jgi:hypothetical protein